MVSLGRRLDPVSDRIRSLVRAIQENDEAKIEEAILRLSRSRRIFAPLALAVSAFVLLFDGLRLLVSNWRLTLVTVLPAMWIWLAMFDLKVHVLHGKSFHVLRGPILIPICLAIIAVTMVSLLSERGVRVRNRQARAPGGPARGGAGAAAPDADLRIGGRRRRAARLLDDDRDALGAPVVRDRA